MSEYDHLDVRTENNAYIVTLDNPDTLNAMNAALLDELEDALDAAETAEGVRAVVLTGAGRAFSSGYDFGGNENMTMDEVITSEYTHLDTIYNLSLPVIAAVDGYALAGGCNLALVCDLTFATERSEFGFPDMRMGELPPGMVLPFVTGSLKYARELFYTGKHIDALEAKRMGLVNHVVAHDELMDEVMDEVDHMKRVPSAVTKLLKDTLNEIQEDHGYRSNSAANVAKYLYAASAETETANKFHEIADTEGVSAAIDWMQTAEKE
jgi:enoyl-CoA hydratase/carnithine racemase